MYRFEEVPLNEEICLMDEKWMPEYERALLESVDETGKNAYEVGYYAYASARTIKSDVIELSWYPNTTDRFHQMRILLPRSAFINCVGSWRYDYKPLIFVSGEWLTNLYLRSHCVFALIDAINFREALSGGLLTRQKLVELRNRIDMIAAANPTVAFISWADSLLLKSHYTIGQYDSQVKNTYQPEHILRLLPDINKAYEEIFGVGVYAVITQGSNEYYEDELLHIADSRNHISFNSLGLPFAQTQAIEQQARRAIRSRVHPPADAYLDEAFYHSLRFRDGFDKNVEVKFTYNAPMATAPTYYFPINFDFLKANLEPSE
jgi:hypothetical protein